MGIIEEELELSHKYELDVEEFKYKKTENSTVEKIVKLTRENVAKVEAMINANSDYKDSKNDKMIYKENEKNKVIQNGSSNYWLKNLKELVDDNNKVITSENHDYTKIIRHLVIAIDIENSTHLNSDKIGREAVAQRILSIDKEKLIKYLKFPGREYELINIIQTPTEKGEKNHFSFATKFCHYTALYLFKGTEYADNFSIYDSIIKKSLPKYIKRYLNEEVKEKDYNKDYNKFITYIDRIRDKAQVEYNEKISRNGLDHLIWYFHK